MRLSIIKYPFVAGIFFSLVSLLASAQVNEDLPSEQVKEDLGNKYYVSTRRQSTTTYRNTLSSKNDDGYFLLGTIASKEEICSLFEHPVFSKEKFTGHRDTTYAYIPIDKIIEEFVSLLPFFPTQLGMHRADGWKWSTRGEIFKLITYKDLGKSIPDMTSTCLPLHLYQNENDSYDGYSSYPLIKWQEAYKDTYDSKVIVKGINITTGRQIIADQRNLRDINIYALLFLKEIHPALIKRFDELHQIELERLAQVKAKNLELEKEKLRLEALAKAQAEAQEHERRLAALEAEEKRLERQERAENERLIEVERIRLQQIEAEEKRLESELRMRRTEFWNGVKSFFLKFSIFSLVVYFIIRNIRERKNEAKEERKRAKEESERLEKDRERRDRELERQTQKSKVTRWTNKNKKLQKAINSIRSSIEEINKQKLALKKQIADFELEKKAIEENITQLNEDIKGEKKAIKQLRKKYPFIDSYIENR